MPTTPQIAMAAIAVAILAGAGLRACGFIRAGMPVHAAIGRAFGPLVAFALAVALLWLTVVMLAEGGNALAR
jgi:hypothetical protein